MDDLTESKMRLANLIEARTDFEKDLSLAVEAGDAPNMISLQRRLDENAVYQYAERAKIIRLTKAGKESEREIAITERDALELQLAEATRQYAAALDVLAEKQLAMNTIQLRLGGLDSSVSLSRDAINDLTRDLRTHIANWKTAATEVSASEL